jgi:hypothetical protein
MLVSKSSLVCLSLLLLGASCSSSHKTTGGNITAKNSTVPASCSNTGKSTTELSWVGVANLTTAAAGGKILPAQFETYTIDNNQLKAFFSAAKQPDQRTIVSIPVPAPVGCQEFEVRSSSAVPPELAEKFPDMASLQGIGTINRAGDLRLDYDGSRLRGQVIWNGQVFLITPVESNGKLVYIIYDKSGSNEKKDAFEQPSNYRNGNSGNSAPQMQKYDR